MAPPCASCERAVYGGIGEPIDPCKASYQLYHEINNLVGVRNTREEKVEALEDFVSYPVTRDMIAYIAQKASEVIPCADDDTAAFKKLSPIPSLELFIAAVVERSHCQVATLMTSLVFLDRLKERLPNIAQGLPCTRHRLFLASLILAAKYVNDSSPKNKHWAIYSHLKQYPDFGFNLVEVNLMEKQMLFLLDWDLVIIQSDLLTHFEPFLEAVRWDRAAVRLEKELLRRELLLDEDAQVPVPQFAIPPPPKGTKPPTDRERKRAHAAGILYPDEERHQFLVSKLEPETLPASYDSVPIIEREPVMLEIDEHDPYLLTKFASSKPEEWERAVFSYGTQHSSNAAAALPPGMFSLDSASFDAAIAAETEMIMSMSRSSTQDSYMSNSSSASRFYSMSREFTPASSMTSLGVSGDELDYDCHDDDDQHAIFVSDDQEVDMSINISPEAKADFASYPSKASKTGTSTKPVYGSATSTSRSRGIPAPSSTSASINIRSIRGGSGGGVISPKANKLRGASGGGGGGIGKVSPTQGHAGVAKKTQQAAAAESKSMLRIRQVLEGGDGGGLKSSLKRSKFLPKFLGGN